jgi:hypothetical protein
MPMYETHRCLVCDLKFDWNAAGDNYAARLLCINDWERMIEWYKRMRMAPRYYYYDDHIHAYITYLEGLRVRSESSR